MSQAATDTEREARIDSILRQLTLAEKVSLVSGAATFSTASVERLGVRGMRFTDGPYGVRSNDSDPATVFPVGLALAATWHPELVGEVGKAIGEETRAMGAQVLLGPNLNLVRSPLSGRNFETYGEDPQLAAQLGVSFVKGVQSVGVAATPKHYVGNEQETERYRSSSNIDPRTLQEVYLTPFEAVVRKARPWALMTAYNRVNGVYASENALLVRDVLKEEWHFDGLVMSDWGGTHSVGAVPAGLDLEMPGPPTVFGEHLIKAVQRKEISVDALNDAVRRVLRLSARTGVLEHAASMSQEVSTAAHRTLARAAAAEAITLLKNSNDVLPLDVSKIRSLAVIGPNADAAIIQGGGSAEVTPSDYVTPLEAIRSLAGRAAITHVQAVDNERYPPIVDPRHLSPTRDHKQRGLIATYYANANFLGKPVQTRVEERIGNLLFGTRVNERAGSLSVRWQGFFWAPVSGPHHFSLEHIAGGSSNNMVMQSGGRIAVRVKFDGKEVVGPNTPATTPTGASFFPTQVHEFTQQLQAGRAYPLEIEYASSGFRVNSMRFSLRRSPGSIEQAAEAARNADVALVFVGSSTTSESEGRDRETLRLFGAQDALVEAVAKANPRTVVVLNNGGPLEMPWVDHVPAVVEAWLPGQEGPRAVADVLFGRINPAGKLPLSFPKRVQDNPSYLYYPGQLDAPYGEGIFVGYRYYDRKDVEPLFPFGHGLSYTRFEYGNLRVPASVREGEDFEISVDVKNIGQREGGEIAQLYISNKHCVEICAVRELKSIGRVMLKPGEVHTVRFRVDSRALSYYDVHRNGWYAEPGVFEAAVGASSRDIRLKKEFTLSGATPTE